MKLNVTKISRTRIARAGFTLVEMLAAMVFMAIVIPVTMEGLSIASRAGDVAHRKILATRVAEKLINESVVNHDWTTSRNGTTREGNIEFNWTVRSDLWKQDTMQEVSAEVKFLAQNHEYSVVLTTLMTYQ